MSRLNSKTRLPALALAALLQLQAASASAKTKPEPAAAAVQEEDQGDACLQDGLCRAHYTRARGLSKESNYAGALAAYEAAYRRRPVPWLLINIGRTLHKLGKPGEALAYYQRYREDDQAPGPERLKLLAEYEQQAEADRAGVAGSPPAPLATDRPAERLPPPPTMPTEPLAGALPPASPSTGAGAADGPADPSQVGGKLALPVGEPAPSGAAGSAVGLGEPRLQRRPAWPGRGLWVGLGVTGGLLLAGTALGITAQVSATQLHNTPYVGTTPSADVLALQERTSRTALAADVLFASTAVALGITLIATLARKPARSAPLAAEPAPGRRPQTVPGPPAAGGGAEPPPASDLLSITGDVSAPSRPVVPGSPAPARPAPDAPGEALKQAPAAGSP